MKFLHLLLFVFISSQILAIDPPTPVSPSNGATGQNPEVYLDWTAVTGNLGYSYEIDVVPTFDSPDYIYGDAAPSSVTITDMKFNTTYYWRARTKGSVDTSVWTSTWSFTTLSATTNTSPSNGAVNQSPETIIDWAGVTGNKGYIYEIDEVATFDSPEYLTGATAMNSSQFTLTDLKFGTTYYWRAAIKNANDTSDWTATWSFTTLSSLTNVSPSNGATGQHPETGLDWSGTGGNSGYIYQVDTVNTFDSPHLAEGATPVNTSYYDIPDLLFGKTYYWRAAAKTASDTSDWSSTWSFTTLSQVTNVSPSNGVTGQNPELIIDWTAVTGNNGYIYELDTVNTFDSPAFQTGDSPVNSSNFTLTDLLFGKTYYWRAAAKTNTDTSTWSNTWSFTTLSTITNVSPTNGAPEEHPETVIDWTAATGNQGYIYEVDTTTSFNSPLLITGNSGVNTSQFTLTDLRFETMYHWRAAVITASDTSEWSTIWSFSTLKKVENISPADGAANFATSLTIDWSAITGNNGYMYEVDTAATFDSPLLITGDSPTNTSQSDLSDLYFGTTYYWRAAAKTISDTSIWGATWSFTTLSQITNTSPANGANGIATDPTLDWNYMSGNQGYIFELDTTPNFDSPYLQSGPTPINTSQTSVSGLMNGTTYYWHAAVKNNVDTSDYSTTWSFNTSYDLTFAPTLILPSNGATDQVITNLLLDWNASADATEYQYQYSDDPTFSTGVISGITSDTEMIISGLNNGTTYYWHVRGSNGTGYSPWSTTWSFTTQVLPPDAPVLISPTNGSTDLSVSTVTLDWEDVADADGYEYEYSLDIGFSSPNGANVAISEDDITGLDYSNTYYWRVRAYIGSVYSDWSEVWSFETEAFELETPILMLPINGAVDQPVTNLTLDWDDVTGVYSYEVEYTLDENFVDDITNIESYASMYIISTGLLYDTVYYWRVRAYDGTSMYSEWSEEWSFRTIEDPTYVDIISDSDISVFPNPTSGLFNIIISQNDQSKIRIFDVGNREVMNAIIQGRTEIDISHLENGIYYLDIQYKNRRFIKKISLVK